MGEKIGRAMRWVKYATIAAVLGAVAAWMGWNALVTIGEVGKTPLAQLTLGQIGLAILWSSGAVIVGVFAMAAWEERDSNEAKW